MAIDNSIKIHLSIEVDAFLLLQWLQAASVCLILPALSIYLAFMFHNHKNTIPNIENIPKSYSYEKNTSTKAEKYILASCEKL